MITNDARTYFHAFLEIAALLTLPGVKGIPQVPTSVAKSKHVRVHRNEDTEYDEVVLGAVHMDAPPPEFQLLACTQIQGNITYIYDEYENY